MADKDVLRASGYSGDIEFDGSTVTVKHNWRGRFGGWKDAHKIDLSRIQRVAYEPAKLMTNGKIDVLVPGETQFDGVSSKNGMFFTKKQSEEFENVYHAINRAITARGPLQTVIASQPKAVETVRYGSSHFVSSGIYSYRSANSAEDRDKSLDGAIATFESGADTSRPTLTRIGAGALLAGPLGAVGGALLKKNTSKCYVTVVFQDGDSVIIEGPIKDEMKLRQFAADVNRLAAN